MPKRIVTGQHEDGTSYFARVEDLEQDPRGIGSYRVWAVDDLTGLRLPFLKRTVPLASPPPEDETREALRTCSPQPRFPGEFRVSLHRMAPAPDGGGEPKPFMHWHNTFDLQWLIAGELTIQLDGGRKNRLSPGDVVVQHGTNHAWRAGPDGALMGIFMYGAERVGVAPPDEDALDQSRWAGLDDTAPAPKDDPGKRWTQAPLPDLLTRMPRRIVTGQREDGVSVFARVEEAEEDAWTTAGGRDRGIIVHRMWASDQLLPMRLPFLGAAAPLQSHPTAEQTPEALRLSSPHPGAGGLRVSLIKFLPNDDGRQFGLHWHDTLDFQWLFAGELTMGLDDGSEVTLQPGDVVVQHGTNHRWRTGPEGAVVALVMYGVERIGVAPPAENRMDETPAAIAGAEGPEQ